MKRAKKFVSLLLVLCMVLSMIPAAVAAGSLPFTDVNRLDWFYDAVEYVYEEGLMSGMEETTFSPNGTTTRGMIVTILHRLEGQPLAYGEAFADVAEDAYYANAVAWASDRGIVNGYGNGCFGPNDAITRQQLAAILFRFAGFYGKDTVPRALLGDYKDADSVADYAVDAMQWAVATDLIKGSDGYLNPYGLATRAQVATVLERFCNTSGSSFLPGFLFGGEGEEEDDGIYTVTFNSNGGSEVETQKIEEGKCATKPEDPTKDGFAFGGWYTDAVCVEVFDFSTQISEDVILYACWIEYNETMEIIAEALGAIEIGYAKGNNADCVTNDIVLPTQIKIDGIEEPISINWISSSLQIDVDGNVSRGYADEMVTLSAEVRYNGEMASRDFCVVVIKQNQDIPIVVNDVEDMRQFSDDGSVPTVYSEDDTIKTIDGAFTNVTVNCCEDAILAIESIKEILGVENPAEEFVTSNAVHANYSNSYTIQQMYDDISVYGRTVTVSTSIEGTPNYVNSGYLDISAINTAPVLSEEDIAGILISKYNEEYLYDVESITIYSLNEYADSPVLAYVVNVYSSEDALIETIFVDSTHGSVIYSEPAVISFGDANVVGKGKDELNRERTFTIRFKQWDWFFYYMQDIDRSITVYNNKIASAHRVGSEVNWWLDKTENSAYANLIEVYDWYNEKIGENPIADRGEIKLVVHSDEYGGIKKDNAAWCSNNEIRFWDNSFFSGYSNTPAAGLDVMAHEYTHGVLEYLTGGIPYSNATGAINEAYADIFGCFVEGDWIIGEDYTGTSTGMRNVSDPSSSGLPEQYLIDANWHPYSDTSDRGGVHTNNTVISYAAYLMSQAGITTNTLIKLWYESLALGYNASSDFYNVRLNVIRAAKDMRLSERQLAIINKAFDDVNIKVGYSLSGKITIADADTNMANNEPLAGAEVRLVGNNINKSVVTDSNGNYKINSIPYGKYTAFVSKEGYITVEQTLEFDYTMEEVYNVAIEAVSDENSGIGYAKGTVYDVGTGRGVPGLTLYVRRGLGNTSGDVVLKAHTMDNGKYGTTIGLEAGNYTVEVVDERTGISDEERYTTTSFNIKILGGMTIDNQNGYVSNGVESEELRVVLSWGSTPSDLDSHLIAPMADGSKFHLYYPYAEENDSHAYTSYFTLDVDDTNSYGPETVTIHDFTDGIYTYAVHDYSNKSSSRSTALANSGAQVKVYRGAELIATYNVPVNMDGTLWTVFTYNSRTKQISTVNTMSYDSSSGGTLMSVGSLDESLSGDGIYQDVSSIITQDVNANEKR